jgi:hypothetical protein
MTRSRFTPPLKNGINQYEMIIVERLSVCLKRDDSNKASNPTSRRSCDNSACKFQLVTFSLYTLFLKIGPHYFATLVFREFH